MSEKDYKQAKHYADNAKVKYLNTNKNKKNSNTSPKTHTSNKTDSNN